MLKAATALIRAAEKASVATALITTEALVNCPHATLPRPMKDHTTVQLTITLNRSEEDK